MAHYCNVEHYSDPGVNANYGFERFSFLDYFAGGTGVTDYSGMSFDIGPPYYAETPYYVRPRNKE